MARAPFQVLVLPYRIRKHYVEYCVFQRSDSMIWQFVSGGGENLETPVEAAVRELYEETTVLHDGRIFQLNSMAKINTSFFREIMNQYPDLSNIPEYSFAIEVESEICISSEHMDYRWVKYDIAVALLQFDSNKRALRELSTRLQ